jgi:hypothetical protein
LAPVSYFCRAQDGRRTDFNDIPSDHSLKIKPIIDAARYHFNPVNFRWIISSNEKGFNFGLMKNEEECESGYKKINVRFHLKVA